MTRICLVHLTRLLGLSSLLDMETTKSTADRIADIYWHLRKQGMSSDNALANISRNLNITKNAVVVAVGGLA